MSPTRPAVIREENMTDARTPALPALRKGPSPQPAGLFMKVDKAEGLLLKDAHVYRLRMKGELKNEDILV